MQLRIKKHDDVIFEWIPYNEFINIKKTRKSDFVTAVWKEGPLFFIGVERKYKRRLNEKVLLKYLYDSQNINYIILNKIANSFGESYGLSQDPNTKNYILALRLKYYCQNCGEKYNNEYNYKFGIYDKRCILCQTSHENDKINGFIKEMILKTDLNSGEVFEWIPYDQFDDIKEIGKGGFSTVYSAVWKDALLHYGSDDSDLKVTLKCIHNSRNFPDKFINKVKAYPNRMVDNIFKLYGISQNPDIKDYIMVLIYKECRNLNNYLNYLNEKCERFTWKWIRNLLMKIIVELDNIHQSQMIHRNFHIGNILVMEDEYKFNRYKIVISDIGLYRKIDDTDETNIYGVMPYVAPEVLKGNPYTKAADIYSLSMIMYFIATGRQPFADCAHDEVLALNIYNGIRPEIEDLFAPKWYIDLMKKCWDSNPDNRPNSTEIKDLLGKYEDYDKNPLSTINCSYTSHLYISIT
ncbi:hypothetical protein RclHR1_01830020 [Rhizophagus clarus]|uniref:Kinase-like domain-containing protein n=1 Tax=Rhizophagus clarus TaxID=94130 RepID=A0A2Z6R2H0_9GLOM|nr:hypothetical protein RclHR1_01830020 [Rhizophagus clarus]GES98060.1 kinase-like domain-containing protein [Rhizophagus clarus]